MSTMARDNLAIHSAEEHGSQSPPCGIRHRLPVERRSLTHHFTVGGHDGYITVGLFPDGQPGEIFVNIAKEGSTLGGLMTSFAKAISIGLQYGVPLKLLCEKFSHVRFEPSGWTSIPEIGFASSIMDYIFRWLQLRFIDMPVGRVLSQERPSVDGTCGAGFDAQESVNVREGGSNGHHHPADALRDVIDMGDAPGCNVCGAICARSGACFRCLTCGQTTGCS